MPIVSVAIPSYNHEKYVGECIQSILNQTYQDFEIIITDDSSTDRTVEVIESFNDPRIKLFRNTNNIGAPASINNCVRHASGKYIASLGSDDAWYPEKLDMQVRYLDQHPDIAVVFSQVDWVDESGNLIANEQNPYKDVFDVENRSRFEWLRHFFEQGNCLNMPSSMVRTKCLTEIGLLNPALAGLHDFDLWVRTCLKYDIIILREKLVRYRWMSDNSNASGNTKKNQIRSEFEYKQILGHYLKITEPQELLMIFPDALKYGKVTTDIIPYFLGRIAIDNGLDLKRLWGQETIFTFLQNEKITQSIKENCNFTYSDFNTLTKEKDIYKTFIGEEVKEKERTIRMLTAHLAEIRSSTGWKAVLLFRQTWAMIAPPNSRRARAFERIMGILIFPFEKIGTNRRIKEDLSLIRSSGLFDEAWYLAGNPDIANSKIDPARHYLLSGGFDKRDPNPDFCSDWYLNTYEDVKIYGINPLVHYLKYGRSEGRMTQDVESAQVAEKRQLAQVPSQTMDLNHTILAPSDKRNGLFPGFKKFIYLFLGIFDKSKRARLKYIQKNDGLISLMKKAIAKVKKTLSNTESDIAQIQSNEVTAMINPVSKRMDIKKWVEYNTKIRLRSFLLSDAVLELPVFERPVVSIILLFFNRAEMSLQCLESLVGGAGSVPFEVMIVDNASTDETLMLLDRIRNARIVRNSVNLGFGGGCNQAADLASGKYLLFLNNDTQLLSNSLKVMVDTIEGGKNIGAVGGKLIFPDGRLQEAGSIIWLDGSCQGYGRSEDPFEPEFSYVKDVDFCSGALLLTPRDLFLSLGKFDSRFAPAYYEDADYCLHLWNKGYRVIYQPFAVAVHYEFSSSGRTNAIALQEKNREKFTNKWKNVLADLDKPKPGNIISSRERKTDSKRILFIDDQIPDYRLGSGYPRTYQLLQMLAEMGYRLTFLPLQKPAMVPEITQSLQLKGIEVIYNGTGQNINFEAFLKSRRDYYDIAFVSRPHNMQEAIIHLKSLAKKTTVIYDAEAIFSLRNIKFEELNGKQISEAEQERLIRNEVSLINGADIVTTVSEMEKDIFIKHGASSVHILGHIVEPSSTPATFEERTGILFVGGILESPSPNEDAVRFFANQIFPLIRQKISCDFYIVGTNKVKAVWDLASDHIHVVGRVDDLTPFYNRCRLFVVPTRYSAGISIKLLEASAHGLPAVITPLTAKQLGWQEDRDVLVGHDPGDFARKVIDLYSSQDVFYSLRQNALHRISEEYSPQQFRKNLENIISLVVDKTGL